MLDSRRTPRQRTTTIIGNSAALRRVLGMVRLVAPTDATVLIQGETGTGKELIAEAIHKCSDRSNGPFVKVNCAAIPAGLLESELFGHERGAYTGAVDARVWTVRAGQPRYACFWTKSGTFRWSCSPSCCASFRRRQFERLGGTATIHTDVRVICATHRNLIEMVDEREFRADLFYRLSVFPDRIAAAARSPRRYPLVSPTFCDALRSSHAEADYSHCRGIHGGSCTPFLARQHSGVAKLH